MGISFVALFIGLVIGVVLRQNRKINWYDYFLSIIRELGIVLIIISLLLGCFIYLMLRYNEKRANVSK